MPPTRYRWDPVREAQRAARLAAQAAKEEQQRMHRRRADETTNLNEQLSTRVQELRHILEHALTARILVSFEHLRVKDKFKPFQIPPQLAQETRRVERAAYFAHLKPPGWLDRLIPGEKKKYEQQEREAEARYQQAVKSYQDSETGRKVRIDNLRAEYDRLHQAYLRRVQESNNEIEELETSYAALEAEYDEGDPSAVTAYISMMLERSEYPEGFPQDFRIAYVPESKELVIEYELPTAEVVPAVAEYRYVKSRAGPSRNRLSPLRIPATTPCARTRILTHFEKSTLAPLCAAKSHTRCCASG